SDFYNSDVTQAIEIRITFRPPPQEFWVDTKFGLCLRGWDKTKKEVVDDPSEDDRLEKVLTIQLKIDESLVPEWSIYTDRNPAGEHISFKDRQKLGITRIGENIHSELSWTRGSALSRLTTDKAEAEKNILAANRDLKKHVDRDGFENLKPSLDIIKIGYEELGLNIKELKASIDPETFKSRIGTLSLHQGKVPARRLGLGSRRLLAIAAQLKCVSDGSIMLIDEVETALEPYKIKHLLRILRSKVEEEYSGQFIFTSHHQAVIEELGCGPLFSVIKNNNIAVTQIPDAIQGTVRSMPTALLSPKVVVCEGATEVGLLRALEQKLLKEDIKKTLAYNHIVVVDAKGGDNVKPSVENLKLIDKKVCVFMDSDKDNLPSEDDCKLIAWADEIKTEKRLENDIPSNTPAGIKALIGQKHIAEAEMLGDWLFNDDNYSRMKSTDFYKKMEQLKAWVNAE
ncbi:MAG: ATP-binding protein, partial [Planctomycetes bacterium]|nr:ATP-binding protein [Planctomycetota bacterium]